MIGAASPGGHHLDERPSIRISSKREPQGMSSAKRESETRRVSRNFYIHTRMWIYIYIYTRTHRYVYIHIYIYIYVSTQTKTYVYTHTDLYTRLHRETYIYICTHKYLDFVLDILASLTDRPNSPA